MDVFSPVRTEADRASLLRQFSPSIPDSLQGNPTWEIALNSEGFRDREFPREKSASAFRIICLGDSWTFGSNIGQEQAYPQQLSALLPQEFPGTDFEVFNLGMLGYTSYQGLELLKRSALAHAPDLVVIGFAMNDATAAYRDKDIPAMRGFKIEGILEKFETYKLLRYLALIATYEPMSMGDHLQALVEPAMEYKNRQEWRAAESCEVTYDKTREPWIRVPLSDYEQNLHEMIALVRSRGAKAILLYNELRPRNPYLTALEQVARAEGVPLVNSSALVAQARQKIEHELEAKLDLQPPTTSLSTGAGEIEVVFRVYAGESHVPKAVYITGTHPQLGDRVPNKIAMYDDGTHGDQRAGDNVWSYAATFSPGTQLFYVYTNSGAEGQWEGLDVPLIRSFTVEAANNAASIYRPIESFGQIYMQADSWHTNASGYTLIARAVLDILKQDERLQEPARR